MATTKRRYPKEEFARQGDEIYERNIIPILRPKDRGKFVAVDIETGAYEVNRDALKACDRLYARLPDAQPWLIRIGSRAAFTFGAAPAKTRR